ncbi:SAG family member [Eimeria mitis]|uniref:SAG family member n=1 Tax=Eimeria mitis TaxID=44415 RepID=U6JYF5_9EIME|nr:SAG family member [Eimeria mitis]CDJ28553.1 SAG family member [Eimeria mitis]
MTWPTRHAFTRTRGTGRLEAAEDKDNVVVVSASLFVLGNANGNAGAQPTYKVAFGTDGQCLAEVNAARLAAGFSALVQAEANTNNRLPDSVTDQPPSDGEWAWTPVCKHLIPESTEQKASRTGAKAQFQSGTYAYLPIDDPASVDCKAVVDKWKDAYTNFDGLPPPNKGEDSLYKNQENVSFVALYNPTEKATADCRVVTCTKTTPVLESAVETENQGQSKETKASALICMTAPDVLADAEKAPFTEDQWGQIVTALEGSASAIAPGVVGFALAIVGLSML